MCPSFLLLTGPQGDRHRDGNLEKEKKKSKLEYWMRVIVFLNSHRRPVPFYIAGFHFGFTHKRNSVFCCEVIDFNPGRPSSRAFSSSLSSPVLEYVAILLLL